MLQSEYMADLVYRYPVKRGLAKCLRRIERNPALKIEPIRQLGSGRNRGRLEELALSIHKLDRTIRSVILVPIQVENTGPEIQGTPKLFGERWICGSHSHSEIQVSRFRQLGVPIAGRVIRAPIRGTLPFSYADADEQPKKYQAHIASFEPSLSFSALAR